jgi:hypothetical protein
MRPPHGLIIRAHQATGIIRGEEGARGEAVEWALISVSLALKSNSGMSILQEELFKDKASSPLSHAFTTMKEATREHGAAAAGLQAQPGDDIRLSR